MLESRQPKVARSSDAESPEVWRGRGDLIRAEKYQVLKDRKPVLSICQKDWHFSVTDLDAIEK